MVSKVLIVDDEWMTLNLLRMMLERAGFEVMEAGNGLDALKRIDEIVPDVIILDVMMPELDGYEVCRRLRARADTADLPVLMLSAKTQPEAVEEGMRAGATRYLPKPITFDDLARNVREVLAGNDGD